MKLPARRASILLDLLFGLEGGRSMTLLNVGWLLTHYTVFTKMDIFIITALRTVSNPTYL
jgi:hypothetical protein